MGFLDDTWFHRSYWVLGQSFAGGHGGYYQAGRFAPSGRLLVNGNGYVFGYGRKPEYFRWTTTLEHQLYAADPNPPEIPKATAGGGNAKGNQAKGAKSKGKNAATASIARSGTYADFPKSESLNPANKPITVEAWVTATKPQGVILASGGGREGFAWLWSTGSRNSSSPLEGNRRAWLPTNRSSAAGITSRRWLIATNRCVCLWMRVVGSGKVRGLLSKEPQ